MSSLNVLTMPVDYLFFYFVIRFLINLVLFCQVRLFLTARI